MNIIVIDDEPFVLQGEVNVVRRCAPGASVEGFLYPQDALAHARTHQVDVAFVDINMPQNDGVELARRLKRAQQDVNMVFATAHDDHYAEAMRMHASGYILKPVSEEDVAAELEELRRPAELSTEPKRLFVRAFGDFEVFYGEQPVLFRYQKTKELFAYLIDRRGAIVESDTLMTVLWGGEVDRSNFFKQIRKDLKDTLEKYGYGDVIISRRGSLGLLTGRIACDYFDWLAGLASGVNAYRGEYMRQYDWAQSTWVNLEGKSNLWET